MIPILFDADAKDFSTRGLGPLSDAKSCKVVEERNGTYELTMQYPKDGIHFADIALNRIVLAVPSPYRDAQPFRIYKISTPMKGVVTVYAQHISYDLSGVAVMPFDATGLSDLFIKLKANSVNENEFEFTGNSALTTKCTYNTPHTARQILGGISGSVIDKFGGEYEFDKYTVRWYSNRGTDNGVTVRYGKNLLTMNQDVDVSKIVTGVIPYWADGEGTTIVVGDRVNMDKEYIFEKIVPLDLSQEYEEQPTKEQLNTRAKSYIQSNYSVEPEINCTVSFALIEQYEEYKDYTLLEQCDLCDIVTVQYPDLGIDSKAKIVKIDMDVLKERYNSVTIGSVRANIAQTIIQQQKVVENVPSRVDMSQLIRNSLDKITGAQGGTVRFLDTNDDGEPDTLYIADNADPTKARRVWRFNYLGWAASRNGYNGPFTLGATLEDGLLADFVTTANLVAGTIKSADNGNTFYLDLTNGILRMKASSFSVGGRTVEDIAESSASSVAGSIANQAANDAVNNFVDAVFDPQIAELQKQIDGQIETYYYDYAPSMNRAPSSQWTTETEKAKHEGDLFFDRSTGYAYRFFKDGSTWVWQQVKDTDITSALQEASEAKDTANQKRRVFVSTPYPPYDVGDLWVQGNNATNGDIMRCALARKSGSYSSSDWVKACNYTDDSGLVAFINGEFAQSIEEAKSQADKKAETWYQSTDPSNAWRTTTEKSGHKGDLWYNSSLNVQKYYRWNGSSWEELKSTPPDAVFDQIDGKAQVFIDTPYTPYHKGDLWFESTSSDILTCITERLTGSFYSGDWVKRNKYTGDESLNDFVSSVYNPKIEELQNQIDGQIETYYYDYDPTLNNYPASEWSTESDKLNHQGDLFYNKLTGKSYRFFKDNGVWGWQLVVDSDVTLALQKASEAKDTADSKRRIFITQPYPPYDEGDLWAQGSHGDIMRCISSRQSGAYASKDWERACDYIDKDAADASAQNAISAQTQRDIFNKLTDSGMRKGIYLEDNGELYINASYLATGILSSRDGETFYLDLDRGILRMKAQELEISGKPIDDYVDDVTQNIKMGGTNLLPRNKMVDANQAIGTEYLGPDIPRGYGWYLSANSGTIVGQTGQLKLKTGTDYTVSFTAWAGTNVELHVDLYPDNLPETTVNIDTQPRRYSCTFNSNYTQMGNCILRFYGPYGFNTDVWVVDPKLEEGNHATDWSPAPEDGEEYAQMIAQQEAEIAAQNAVKAQTQLDIFNKLTDGGKLRGLYMQDGKLYINADYLATGTLTSRDGKSFSLNLETGEITAEKLSWQAQNSSMTQDGTFSCTNADINGTIKCMSTKSGAGNSVVTQGTLIDLVTGIIFNFTEECINGNRYRTSFRAQDYSTIIAAYFVEDTAENILNELKQVGLDKYSNKQFSLGTVEDVSFIGRGIRTYGAVELYLISDDRIELQANSHVHLQANSAVNFTSPVIRVSNGATWGDGYTGTAYTGQNTLYFINGICTGIN